MDLAELNRSRRVWLCVLLGCPDDKIQAKPMEVKQRDIKQTVYIFHKSTKRPGVALYSKYTFWRMCENVPGKGPKRVRFYVYIGLVQRRIPIGGGGDCAGT